MNYSYLITFGIILVVLLLIVGNITKKWTRAGSDFNVAGREVGWLVTAVGITGIAFAGTSLSLVPSFSIMYGFAGGFSWALTLCIGLPLYATMFGSALRRCGARTLSEWMEVKFGGKTRTIIAVGQIIGLCGLMANNIAGFAASFTAYTGLPIWVSVALCYLILILITSLGGLHAVNMTNVPLVIIGLIAIPAFMFILFNLFGSVDYISQNWPGGGSWLTTGFTGESLPILSLQYPSVLTFISLMGVFLIWGSNHEYLRIASGRSEKLTTKECLHRHA